MPNKNFRFITTFSGAGGAEQGLMDAGGEGLFALDFEKNAVDDLKLNFPELARKGCILQDDIKNVPAEKIMALTGLKPRELNIYQASPPCQGFSRNNSNAKMTDPRNYLAFEAIKHIRVLQPEVVIFENVANLSGPENAPLLHAITSSVERAGYEVGVWVLDASRYGIPQKRKRLWLIGVREDIGISPSVPEYTDEFVGVSDSCPHLQGFKSTQYQQKSFPGTLPLSTLTKSSCLQVIQDGKAINPMIDDLKTLCTFPKEFKLIGSYRQQSQRLGNSVLPRQMELLAAHLYDTVIDIYHNGSKPEEPATNDLDDFERKLMAEIDGYDVDTLGKTYG